MEINKDKQKFDATTLIDSPVEQIMGDKITNIFNLPSILSELSFVITKNTDADTLVTNSFQGRERELQTIKDYITQNKKAILINGMGGIGKSEICKKLYHEYINEYKEGKSIDIDHIGFMKYGTSMDSTLVNALGIQTDNYEQSVQIAWNQLKQIADNYRLVLFIDNINTTPKQDESLQKLYSLSSAIIVTSRNKSLGEFQLLEIDKMEYPQCRDLFISIYGVLLENEEHVLEYIIETLAARHTLTVKLFASIAKSNSWTISQLKGKLEEYHFKLSYLKDDEEQILLEEYKKLFALSDLSDDEKNILEDFSIMPYRMLPIETCIQWFSSDLKVDSVELLINKIYQKGWLESKDRKFCIHPVLSELLRTIRKPHIQNHIEMVKICINSLNIDIIGILNKETKYFEVPYIPFVEAIMENLWDGLSIDWLEQTIAMHKKLITLYRMHLANRCYRQSRLYFNLLKYDEAIKNFSQCIYYLKNELGSEHKETKDAICKIKYYFLKTGKNESDFDKWLEGILKAE